MQENVCRGFWGAEKFVLKFFFLFFFLNFRYSLPRIHPLVCPLCDIKPQRDKINLGRHVAFGHKKIYDFCTDKVIQTEAKKKKKWSQKVE